MGDNKAVTWHIKMRKINNFTQKKDMNETLNILFFDEKLHNNSTVKVNLLFIIAIIILHVRGLRKKIKHSSIKLHREIITFKSLGSSF